MELKKTAKNNEVQEMDDEIEYQEEYIVWRREPRQKRVDLKVKDDGTWIMKVYGVGVSLAEGIFAQSAEDLDQIAANVLCAAGLLDSLGQREAEPVDQSDEDEPRGEVIIV